MMSKKCTKKCAVCADLQKGQTVITYGSKNPKMYKLVYSETTGHYENVPVLLRGTFYTYSVSANKNETFIIK